MVVLLLAGCGVVGARYTAHGTRDGAVGVVVLAHGGSSQWNQAVRKAVQQAKLPQPKEIVFGMGMHAREVRELQQAVTNLERRGVDRLVVVPLLVSSHSEVMQQYAYLLGESPHGTWEGAIKPVTRRVPAVLTPALDDDPVVAQILLERAQAISRHPQQERVILVAHGPVSEQDDSRWLQMMERIAEDLRRRGGFREIVPVTLRDDAPPDVVAGATERLRTAVSQGAARGRVLVVPLLLATGGIEANIPQRLAGLSYVYAGQALLPHAAIAQWIARQVARAARL